MKHLSVHNRGADLAVYVSGSPAQPPLLLLSSLGADRRMWDANMELFSRAHRVVTFDTRGHGNSGATPAPYDLELLLSDVVAVLDSLSIDRTDVVGLSLGGALAVGLALAEPSRVERLVVCDAQIQSTEEYRSGWDQRIAAVKDGGLAAIADGTLSRWFTPDCQDEIRDRARDMLLTTTIDGYAGCANCLKQLDYLASLGQISAPVLYVRGEDDVAAPASVMEEMNRCTPNSELRIVKNAAHIPNMENPDGFADAVEGWLAKSPKASGVGAPS
ncbi:MAG: alpha/beta fold hydrolase [Hoeflea sp.]|uniref:alpha/beta fold hydrolase n=1 Tax=Hoeflea sp. TaxID=1940281 RepID=UPI0032EC4156